MKKKLYRPNLTSNPIRFKIAILQNCFEAEVSNSIDEANSSQDSFRFTIIPDAVKIDESSYLLPNGAFDFSNAIKDLVSRDLAIKKLVSQNLVLVTSRPFSDMDLVREFRGKSLTEELSQCYFYESFNFKSGWQALISTFIWEHLPLKKELNLLASPSGRRALQPYMLFMFATLALDRLVTIAFHEESRGCPFDYCNNVYEIDESFRIRKICEEHEEFLRRNIAKGRITKRQFVSAMGLFNRAFGKPAKFKFDLAISYASPDRKVAEKFAQAISSAGFSVFFDKYFEEEIWGKTLVGYLDDVYRKDSRYCLMLISKEYDESMWTDHERHSAVVRALEERGHEYILPVCLDDTKLREIPQDLAYLDLRERNDKRIEEVANILIKKLDP